MTYADERRGGGGGGARVLKNNGVSAQRAPQLQAQPPRNSLQYWNKAQDRQGITVYWNNAANPYMSKEEIYGMSNGTKRRPAPFPLSLPSSPIANGSPAGREAMMIPPLSANSKMRWIPSGTVDSATTTGIYQNLGAKQVRTTQSKPEILAERANVGLHKSDSYAIAPTSRPEPLIWSVTNDSSRPKPHQPPPANAANPISSSPIAYGGFHAHTPGNFRISSFDEKPRVDRKPRWGRFIQSMCCCVAPPTQHDKSSSMGPRRPSQLITQVSKSMSNGNAGSHTPLKDKDDTDRHHDNDYSPAPTISPSLLSSKTSADCLLPPLRPADVNKKCLIIDLDETLVHSSFKPVKNPDFVIPVEIDNVVHQVYVLKRPYVDEFLARVGDRYECVLFTASLAKYADPVADLLDKHGVFRHRLFREACVYNKGNYVKDLARLGRDLKRTIIIDNSPASYAFHPDNAIPVQTWFDDAGDMELLDILPLLDRLEKVESVYDVLAQRPHTPISVLLQQHE